eukprot:scaffold37711_cov14-Tisochrysis_lutea.AAC.1
MQVLVVAKRTCTCSTSDLVLFLALFILHPIQMLESERTWTRSRLSFITISVSHHICLHGCSPQDEALMHQSALGPGAGFHSSPFPPRDETLLHQCLLAVRTSALAELRAKARILVTDGVCLIGAPDETGQLREECVFLQ